MSFEIRIVDHDDKGVQGARVVLSFTDPTRGQADSEHTDSDGCAEFDGFADGEVKVFVDGNEYGTYEYRDGESVTITQ